jgi:hypothetical protein
MRNWFRYYRTALYTPSSPKRLEDGARSEVGLPARRTGVCQATAILPPSCSRRPLTCSA